VFRSTHSEVDIAGDHEGVCGLADWIGRETVGELVLDQVSASWLGVGTQALEAIGLLQRRPIRTSRLRKERSW
jgi:hypothetical protein